jgi:hypothetical protein
MFCLDNKICLKHTSRKLTSLMKKIIPVLFIICCVGCVTTGSSTKSSKDSSGNVIALSNHYYNKSFFVDEKLLVIANAEMEGASKGKMSHINLDILFNNKSVQRVDIQLDLIKYIHDDHSETFFAGPKTITLPPNAVEPLQLKNLKILDDDNPVKLIFIYSYLDNRRMMEVNLKRLTKDEYKQIKR